ncbi:hypothetical protein WJX81_004594 [Elliptochloris bilobata]|uniref:Uncharacterized protein n=1 Tax=Elliptochloris bilobata TaxID=381761 RepID=A0AAW1SJK1_9CHLO
MRTEVAPYSSAGIQVRVRPSVKMRTRALAALVAVAALATLAHQSSAQEFLFGNEGPKVMVNPTDPSIPINPMSTAPVDTAAIVDAGGDPISPPDATLLPTDATRMDRAARKWNATLDMLFHHNLSDFTGHKIVHRIFGNDTSGGRMVGGLNRAATPVRSASVSGINYYGGPLMVQNPININYIWYGNWAGNTATTILTNLAKNMGGSSWYHIMATYYQLVGATKTVVPTGGATPALRYAASVNDAYSQGKSLSDAQVQTIVQRAIAGGGLGKVDPNGMYFVLASQDVTATSGFCTAYCAWHTYYVQQGIPVKFTFVGNGARCPNSCAPFSPGPNNNQGADGMASTLSHELVEMVSDPVFNGWYDANGYENADKCAWTYGTTYRTKTNALYNVNIGPFQYMIQRNWLNLGTGSCVSTY